jgi:hypothetical protein
MPHDVHLIGAAYDRLAAVPRELADALWLRFAALVETQREGDTIPLDFQLAGVIARCDRRDSLA